MPFETFIKDSADAVLFISCLFVLFGSLFLTFKMKLIQFRLLPSLYRMMVALPTKENNENSHHMVSPKKALFTAMSTTLGISTIVAPVIAIKLGGPGALIGFLLTAFFGGAATYAEVHLSIQYRKKLKSGSIMGGPMQYLKCILSPFGAKWYAVCCLILMTAWSGAQANQLAAILDSPLLGVYRIPTIISGLIIALLVMVTLIGGVKRISAFSAKLVPIMFTLYISATLFIIFCNFNVLGNVFYTIIKSAFSPYAMTSGALVGGIVSSLRWGIFKGTQTSEAGIGTQAIPHSLAETIDPEAQATLAMFSTYMAGFVAFLSGIVALLTNTWQDPNLPLGISMVAASFEIYFSYFGVIVIAISTLLFGFGTCLGNSFNGSQCFSYLTENKKLIFYTLATGVMIFIGAISDATTFWSFIDLVLAAVAVPHMAALMLHAHKNPIFNK